MIALSHRPALGISLTSNDPGDDGGVLDHRRLAHNQATPSAFRNVAVLFDHVRAQLPGVLHVLGLGISWEDREYMI